MNKNTFMHRAYGLLLEAEFELPELACIDAADLRASDVVDVTVQFGDVPDCLPGRPVPEAWVDVDGDLCLLRFNGIGSFLVEQGRRITVQKEAQVSIGDLRGFLLGSAIAGIVHQRGLVPLHVSAVLAPDGAIAFTGDSGAGKSTMAAHLHREMGWPLISDDVSRVHSSAKRVEIESGVYTVKLWNDALMSLERTSEGLRRDLTRYDKFHAIDSDKFIAGRTPLNRLILLKWGSSLSLNRLTGRRAFQTALNAVYRPELARLCGNRETVVEAAMSVASTVSVFELERPKGELIGNGVRESISHLLEQELRDSR